jgi:hypothetical protein
MKSIKEILGNKSSTMDMKMPDMFGKSKDTFGSLNLNTKSSNMKMSNLFGKSNNTFGSLNFGNKSSNTKGASLSMQKQWANMTTPQRAAIYRKYPDSDRDGVPDRWDCQPYNKYKQDTVHIRVNKKTLNEWEDIFVEWAVEMDELYPNDARYDASQWTDSPADWMTPYDDKVFMAWVDYDVDAPFWQEKIKHLIK